jgi:hypothetical protein
VCLNVIVKKSPINIISQICFQRRIWQLQQPIKEPPKKFKKKQWRCLVRPRDIRFSQKNLILPPDPVPDTVVLTT